MQEIANKLYLMVMALKRGWMEVHMWDNIIWEERMEEGNIHGPMVVTIMVIGEITKQRDKEFGFKATGGIIKESLLITKCMDLELLSGKVADFTKGNMCVIINRDSENIIGPMETLFKDSGREVKDMVKALC